MTMQVRSLSLVDFRSYRSSQVEFGRGLTVIRGPNGHGKTNLLEALAYVAGLGSFRGAADGAMIRDGADSALISCEARAEQDREVLISAELSRSRVNRMLVNRQSVTRRRDLLGVLSVTVFSPEDLDLVKGEPSGRRRWIDDALASVRPAWSALRSELDRILRQRNVLLRQAAGRADGDVAITLDVWDAKLAAVGDELRNGRCELLDALNPALHDHYGEISATGEAASARYVSSWGDEPLSEALLQARADDLRRAITTIGPHRDDIELSIGASPARTHASQGEQRSLAVALRLAVDAQIRRSRGVEPVLLLDDVFSELDARRCAALLQTLPATQRILTTASSDLPAGINPEQVLEVRDGDLHQVSST